MDGWMDGWMDGGMDGGVDERVNGWTNGWKNSWLGQKSHTASSKSVTRKSYMDHGTRGKKSWDVFSSQKSQLAQCLFCYYDETIDLGDHFFTLELKKERFICISLRFLVSPTLLSYMDYNVSLNCLYPWAILALKYILWRNYCIPTLLENLLDLV